MAGVSVQYNFMRKIVSGWEKWQACGWSQEDGWQLPEHGWSHWVLDLKACDWH